MGYPTKGGSCPEALITMKPLKIPRALLIGLVQGCMFMPGSGPSGEKFLKQAGKDTGPPSYQLIPGNDQVIHSISAHSA